MVDGLLLSELRTPGVIATSRGSTFFLRVPASMESNNTVVRCEVIILDPFSIETSDPATLTVQGMFIYRKGAMLQDLVQCVTFFCM